MKTTSHISHRPASFALLAFVASALAFFTGCESAPEIKYEADRTVDVSAYKTFYLIPFSKTAGVSGQGADPGSSLKLAGPVTSAITSALLAKGYTQATTPAASDFAVNVRATVVPQTDVTDMGLGYAGYAGWRYGGYWGGMGGYNVSVDQYNKGVLRIEVFDSKKKQLVWVGWATDRLDDNPDVSKLPGIVTSIFANFPAAAGSRK
ncbi:MAG: DUF4136 domain-containing protein [Lacunisphaera sp.]